MKENLKVVAFGNVAKVLLFQLFLTQIHSRFPGHCDIYSQHTLPEIGRVGTNDASSTTFIIPYGTILITKIFIEEACSHFYGSSPTYNTSNETVPIVANTLPQEEAWRRKNEYVNVYQ